MEELSQFLEINTRADLKVSVLQYLLGLSGNKDGLNLIAQCKDVLKKIMLLTDDIEIIKKDSILCLVNISAEAVGSEAIMSLNKTIGVEKSFITKIVEFIIDENCKIADGSCMLLCNISRTEQLLNQCVEDIFPYLTQILNAFTKINYNKTGANLHYLGPLFSNLSGDDRVRNWLCHDKLSQGGAIRVASFTQFLESTVRRGGAVGTIRNLCFDVDLHDWLLNSEIDILSYILLPLAGGEEFSDDEMTALPLSLQYLPKDKQREQDPDIRKLLLESLNKLCIKKSARETLRNCGTYYILRELHKWEKDRKTLLACENVVDILIKKEDEIMIEDMTKVDVPEEYNEKFIKMDDDFVNDL